MAIPCLGRPLRLDGYGFIGELALDGSVRPVTGVLRVEGRRRDCERPCQRPSAAASE